MSDSDTPDWHVRGPTDAVARSGPAAVPSADGTRRLEGMAQPRYVRIRSRGHRTSSSSRRKIRRLRILAVLLATGMVASIVFSVSLYFYTKRLHGGEQRLTATQVQLEGELAKARERIDELNNDLRILLANRLPGVDELVFNRPIELNDQYVKNITFVRSGVDGDTSIELTAVLQNGRTDRILPEVTIALFDESGLQNGSARLDNSQTITPTASPELQPGETRTYSTRIKLDRQAPPKYYVVEVR